MRSALISYRAIISTGVIMAVIHVWWLSRSEHAGEVISAFGAVTVALGVWVASRPYVRIGLEGMIQAALPKDDAGYLVGPNHLQELTDLQTAARPKIVQDIWAERIIAVVVIIVGTLLNGYGTPIARLMGMRV